MSSNTFKEDIAIGVSATLERSIAEVANSLQSQRDQIIGAREAHTVGQQRIEALFAQSDALMQSGELSEEQRAAWRRALRLAHGALESLRQTADVRLHEIDGQIKAYGDVLGVVGKHKGSYEQAREAIRTEAERLERERVAAEELAEARAADRERRRIEAEQAEQARAEGVRPPKRLAPMGTKALRHREVNEDGTPIEPATEHEGEPVGRRTSHRLATD